MKDACANRFSLSWRVKWKVDNVLQSCLNQKMLQGDSAEMLEIPGMCAFVIGAQWSIKAILSALRGFQGTLGREDHLDQMESQYVTHIKIHTLATHTRMNLCTRTPTPGV